MEQLGAGTRSQRVQAFTELALERIRTHRRSLVGCYDRAVWNKLKK